MLIRNETCGRLTERLECYTCHHNDMTPADWLSNTTSRDILSVIMVTDQQTLDTEPLLA